MTNIIPFSFENRPMRVTDQNGDPWFVLTDACVILGIRNSRDAAGRLDDDEKGVVSTDTLGGKQDVTIINESGLWSLVLTSRKPEAKRFRKWITSEVFPSIRKTGGYGAVVKAVDRAPRIDVVRESRMQMAFNLRLAKMIGLSGNQAVLAANRATVALTGVSALSKMGADHLDAPSNDVLLTPTEIGRRTGLGSGRTVNARLCLLGLQRSFRDAKGHVYYEPTQAGLSAGATMQDTGKSHSNGTPVRQLKWSSSIIDTLGGEKSAA